MMLFRSYQVKDIVIASATSPTGLNWAKPGGVILGNLQARLSWPKTSLTLPDDPLTPVRLSAGHADPDQGPRPQKESQP
jgi:hypothetical protein